MSLLYQMIFVDVSEFVSAPLRTGVQRVLIQVTRNLPRARLVPFKIMGPDHVGILDPTLFDVMAAFFDSGSPTVRSRVARAHVGTGLDETAEEMLVRMMGNRPIAVLPASKFYRRAELVLNLENFADIDRSMFYLNWPDPYRHKVFHLIHDFLLFEEPRLFPQLDWRRAPGYVRLFDAWSVAGGFFVSTAEMARKVTHYFNRRPEDVTIVGYGSDLTGPPPKPEREGIPRVVMLGTIEPRKYPEETVAALDDLMADNDQQVECLVVGSWGWVSEASRARIESILARGRVRHLQNLSDIEVAEIMAHTDVAVYLSEAEGFGLPVIEFAARGIPVVTNAAVPSATLISDQLRVTVPTVTVPNIVAGLREGLRRGIQLDERYTQSWADCAREILTVLEAKSTRPLDPSAALRVRRGWEVTARLAKRFEPGPMDWEELKRDVKRELLLLLPDGAIEITDATGRRLAELPDELLENTAEIVSDNRGLLYWTEIEIARPFIVRLMHCVLSDNYIECLRQGYRTFMGRNIDPRAAAEVPVYSPLSRSLGRLRELINSDECQNYLGRERWTALSKVMRELAPVMNAVVNETFDLFHVFSVLGMGEPQLEQVFEAAALLSEDISPVEIALYFGRHRKLKSDVTALYLDVLAEVYESRGVQIKSAYTQRELAEIDDTRQFIRRAYRLILRKEVDDEGLNYYYTALYRGYITRADMLSRLTETYEARSRRITVV